MPYGKWQNGDQICVYKKDADGNRIGEPLGCHPTEDAADAQIAALYANEIRSEDVQYFAGGMVRAVGNGIVEGLLVPFNTRDNPDWYGTYFDANTDYVTEDFPPTRAVVMYDHGIDETLSIRNLGTPLRAKFTDKGLWAQAQLKLRDEWEQEVYKLAEDGKLGWSSGALPQSVEVAEDGHMERWAIIDWTLTPRPAAVPYASQIYTRSAYQRTLRDTKAGLDLKALVKASDNALPLSTDKRQENPDMDAEKLQQIAAMVQEAAQMLIEYANAAQQQNGGEPMPPEVQQEMANELNTAMNARIAAMEDVLAEMSEDKRQLWVDQELAKALPEAIKAHEKRKAERAAQFQNAARDAYKQVEPNPVPGYVGGSAPRISGGDDLRFAHLSAADMCCAVMMKAAVAKRSGLTHVALDQMFSRAFLDNLRGKVGDEIKGQPFGKKAKANATLRSLVPFRADEQNATDIATQGTEWVGDYWSTTLWEKERYPRIFDQLVSKGMMVEDIPQGTDSANFPTEGADPTAYMTPEGNNLDASGRPETVVNINPFATGKVTLTPKEISIASSVTVRMDEDSVIRVAQQVSRQLEEKMMETRDQMMINGDTETAASTNINLIDGTPGTGLQTPYYLAADGFRKMPLITNTDGARDAAGGLGLADYRKTLALLDGTLRQYKERCLYIIDTDTEMASLAIPEMLTISERPVTFASIESGSLVQVYKIDVTTSGFLPETNTSGMVSATSGNNTQGSILLVYAPYWGFGYKRQMTLETEYSALWKSTVYVMSVRMGIIARGTNASVISYNVANA
jgi:hypothetical protein